MLLKICDGMKKRILLIDDDKICNFITETTLNRLGVAEEIQAVLHGKEAFEYINHALSGNQILPDVIFLDLNMPLMNGFTFIESFMKLDFPKKEKVKIVVLTSSENPEDIVKVKKLGINYYLTKPINESKLLEILKN